MATCWLATGKEPAKYKRALPPAHYSLKIESFSALSWLGKDKYDSEVFKAGGYRWSLSLYPNGNEKDNGPGYISLYLSIEERDKLDDGLKVHINYKLFVYNKSQKEYLTIQDAEGAMSSFHRSKIQRGFPQFLSLKKFKKDGYLEGDSCTFWTEVFVIQPAQLRGGVFYLDQIPDSKNTHMEYPRLVRIGHTSPLQRVYHRRKAMLLVDPKGNTDSKEKSMSVYLEVQRLTGKKKVYAEFSLHVLDQLEDQHKDKEFKCWLSASHPRGGDADFMPLRDLLKKSRKGFVSNDTLIVEVQLSIISV